MLEYRHNVGVYVKLRLPRNANEYGFVTVQQVYVHDDFGNLVLIRDYDNA